MRAGPWTAALVFLSVAPAAATELPESALPAALASALPGGGSTDVVLVQMPFTPRAPHVWAATPVGATPAAVKAVLLDPAHFRAVIPGLVRSEIRSEDADGAAGRIALTELGSAERSRRGRAREPSQGSRLVDWELEVPLVNLSGRVGLTERADGVDVEMISGDLSPGRIRFTIAARPGGSTLVVDAQLDIGNSSWLLRHIMARSPVGQPAALLASAYVALRAVALRAEHSADTRAWRPTAAMTPPPSWRPDATPLGAAGLEPLRARGPVGLVARAPTGRLEGVAMIVAIEKPIAFLAARLRDPDSWHAFPGWHTVRPRPGPYGAGADVEDNLPLADFDATWVAEPGPVARWTAGAGETRGARLGWELFPGGGARTLTALLLYPRLETTGRLARRSIASEPLLEQALAAALVLADVTAMKQTLEATHAP